MKKIKMVLYGEPGVGKSVFASKAPNPFFICTDGNYEWLEDFGAKPESHKQVSSFSEFKQLISNTELLNKYDTIVVDLLEDLFKWCEYEFCVRTKIDHVSDLGFAKGYDTTRNEFFISICKLLAYDKNIIFIMHGITSSVKDRRGIEHTKYFPSSRVPDKVIDMIEGRVRYFLRCYLKGEETSTGIIHKNRYLSLIPKENEFGIARGLDESVVPTDILLEWSEFSNIVLNVKENTNNENKLNDMMIDTNTSDTNTSDTLSINTLDVVQIDGNELCEESKEKTEINETKTKTLSVQEKLEQIKAKTKNNLPQNEEKVEKSITNNDVIQEKNTVETVKELTQAEKLAAIKAKLAALYNNK